MFILPLFLYALMPFSMVRCVSAEETFGEIEDFDVQSFINDLFVAKNDPQSGRDRLELNLQRDDVDRNDEIFAKIKAMIRTLLEAGEHEKVEAIWEHLKYLQRRSTSIHTAKPEEL